MDAESGDQPAPRQAKTSEHQAVIKAQNRRREYLERTPEYFHNVEHELSDPVLYERLVKRYQSAEERQAEGKKKGYGRTLEADLVRGETKISNIRPGAEADAISSSSPMSVARQRLKGGEPWDQDVSDKNQGLELWKEYLCDRFIRGDDEEFDYTRVDSNEDLDVLARADAEDEWFDQEEPSWHEEQGEASLQGETGVQDY